MTLSGGGREASKWVGVDAVILIFVSVPGVNTVNEENEKNRGRDTKADCAAFFVIDIVDIVVCERPDRVMSTEASRKRAEYRLLVWVYAARGSTRVVKPEGDPPSETCNGSGMSTVRELVVNDELAVTLVLRDPTDADRSRRT